MPKFFRTVCEVCHEPIIDEFQLPPDIRDEIYRPGADEVMTNVVLHRTEDGTEPPEPEFEIELN